MVLVTGLEVNVYKSGISLMKKGKLLSFLSSDWNPMCSCPIPHPSLLLGDQAGDVVSGSPQAGGFWTWKGLRSPIRQPSCLSTVLPTGLLTLRPVVGM